VKLLLRCVAAAIFFVAVVAVASTLTFAEPLAMLGWPGLLVVNAVCARFMIFERTPGNFAPIFVAGLVLDVVIYAVLFVVVIKGWRKLAPKITSRS